MEEKTLQHCKNINITVNELAKELGISFNEAISIFMMRELTIVNSQLIGIQEKLKTSEKQNSSRSQTKKKNKEEVA